jgi:hypothetical protein
MDTLSPEALAHIATLKFEPRREQGIEAAWSHDLDAILDWYCESGICSGESDGDGEYHGWAKWQRVEREQVGHAITSLTIECGHCGWERQYIEDDPE